NRAICSLLQPLHSSPIKCVASSHPPPVGDVVESRKTSGDGLPILRRPRQKRAVSPSGAATSQPRGARLLELRIHQEGSKRLRHLDQLRWREGEEVHDVGLCLFGEIPQVRFDDRVSFLGRHTLELSIDHTDADRCRVVAVRVDRLEPRVCQNLFDLAGFACPFGFPRTRGGMRHGSCLSTQSYMAFAVVRKAVVSPVSRRPARSEAPLSNRAAAFAWPGRAEETPPGFATHRAELPVDAFLPRPLSP